MAAVVLKYSPRFMVLPVDRNPLNPSLAAMTISRRWLLVQATEVIVGKHNVLGRKPSQMLSVVLQLFQPGNRSPSSLGHNFEYDFEGSKLD